MRKLSSTVFCFTVLLTLPAHLRGQDASQKIRAQRDTLERIRQERETLEHRAAELQSSVHDLNEEVTNLDRRRQATARIVSTLDEQLATILGEVDQTSDSIALTETELAAKRSTLHRRLVDIYKRGPLFTTSVMLSARSFGDLVARYKYLHLLTLRDRALVTRVEQLRDQVVIEHNRLVVLQTTLEESRADKANEEERLRALEHEQAANLAQAQEQAKQAEDGLARLRKTEAQLTSTIAALEAERLRAERARPAAAAKAASAIKTSDYGKLEWPVDGALLYSFGKAQTASNTTIRWNGVGIRAPAGTPVHAVAAGRIAKVSPLGTYGLTVIIDHGAGDYSIYGSLNRAEVREQQTVTKGEVIGSVGASDPDQPPHLHFEIRHGGPAIDPASWLRANR